MMTSLYFIRHGESQANADGVIAGSLDSPLTEKGVAQAHAVAKAILADNIQIDTIIASPLSRAHDTAKIVANTIEYSIRDIILVEELQEKAAGDFEGSAIDLLYAATDEEMRRARAESFDDFAERVKQANDKIREHAKGVSLVVGHAGIYRMAQVLYRGLPPSDMKIMKSVPNGQLKEYPL